MGRLYLTEYNIKPSLGMILGFEDDECGLNTYRVVYPITEYDGKLYHVVQNCLTETQKYVACLDEYFVVEPGCREAMDFTIREYRRCEDCGKLITGLNEERVILCNDLVIRHVCFDCYFDNDDYYRCDYCGDNYRRSEGVRRTQDGAYVCRTCHNLHVRQCSHCGNEYLISALRSTDSGILLCGTCFNEEIANQADKTVLIHKHWSKLPVAFHHHKYEYTAKEKIPGVMYYGMELELECNKEERNKTTVAGKIRDIKGVNWYLEEDGSLDYGIEVICHARTFESWQEFFPVFNDKVLRVADSMGCKAHDTSTCGMHIHSSLDAWGSRQLYRLFSLLYNPENYIPILIISQRKEHHLEEWASLKVSGIIYYRDNIEKKVTPFVSRHMGLNITKDTVEFRIFRSSLNIARVRKNLEFVHALYLYTLKDDNALDWLGFLEYVKHNKHMFPFLNDFLLNFLGKIDAAKEIIKVSEDEQDLFYHELVAGRAYGANTEAMLNRRRRLNETRDRVYTPQESDNETLTQLRELAQLAQSTLYGT